MKKQRVIYLFMLSLLLSACVSTNTSKTAGAISIKKGLFSRFTQVKLIPTVLSSSLAQRNINKRAAIQLDRELVIRLSKNLHNKKMIPTNHQATAQTLNIIPRFEVYEQSIRLHVLFQNGLTHQAVDIKTLDVPYTAKQGFHGSDRESVLLAKLAQELVRFIVGSS